MTSEEIKDLIASAIAGQGNQVDSGGKLAEILNAIVDMAGGPAAPTYVDCGYSEADNEPVFDNEQKAALLQEYNKGNLANVVCRYHNEETTFRYFKIVAWEATGGTLTIIGANTGGTTTVKRWQVNITFF